MEGTIITIKIDIRSAIIVLLSVLILIAGAYFYRNVDIAENEELFENTQELILRLQLSPAVGTLFEQVGWETIHLDPTPNNMGNVIKP